VWFAKDEKVSAEGTMTFFRRNWGKAPAAGLADGYFVKKRKNGTKISKRLKYRQEDDKFIEFKNFGRILWVLIDVNS